MLLLSASLLLSLLTAYATGVCYRNYRKLSNFKGPFLACISELWLLVQSLGHRQQDGLFKVLEKHGPYARIGPKLLVTNDPDLLRHMSAPRSLWTRGKWYEIHKFDASTDNIFSTIDEKKHAQLRSKIGPAVRYDCFFTALPIAAAYPAAIH